MKRLVEKHPLAIRWFHWVNFPLLCLMIWSGLLISWAHSDERFFGGVYRIGWGETTFFHLFPEGFWSFFGLHHRLAEGMGWHFLFMWFFAANGVLYVLYTALSGEWRHLVPGRGALRGALQVALHDLRIVKALPKYERYNPAQQIAYTLVILMGAGSLLTGLAIYKPVQLGWLTALFGGYQTARWVHFWLTMGYVAFFAIHLVQVVRAGWGNFRSMVAGCDLEEIEEPRDATR